MKKLDYRISSLPINYKLGFVNASQAAFTLSLSENNTNILSKSLAGYGNASYTVGVAYTESATFNGILQDNRSVLKISLSSLAVNSVGYLDYFEISYEKELKPVDNNLIFFSKDTSAVVEYYLSSFPSEIKVFDVTDFDNVSQVSPMPAGQVVLILDSRLVRMLIKSENILQSEMKIFLSPRIHRR